ncbi:MAG: carboxypeptidase-like regulatory domain-containing protein, partial [bacterium]
RSAVSGRILSFYSPFTAIPNADVTLAPGTFVARANQSGDFSIADVPSGTYVISAEKEGFAIDSDTITVTLGQPLFVELNLDALPIVNSVSINSCHISRNFPQEDLYFLEIKADVDDPDGVNDIDFVQMSVPSLNFSDTLDITQSPGRFAKIISSSQLPLTDIRDILGHQIVLSAHDRPGFNKSSQPRLLARIIERTPLTDSPNQSETLSDATPLLTWRPVDLLFDFTYVIEVVRVDFGFNTTVWRREGIDKTITSIAVADALQAGVYFWTVSVFDRFGNWSRSKEAPFRIN